MFLGARRVQQATPHRSQPAYRLPDIGHVSAPYASAARCPRRPHSRSGRATGPDDHYFGRHPNSLTGAASSNERLGLFGAVALTATAPIRSWPPESLPVVWPQSSIASGRGHPVRRGGPGSGRVLVPPGAVPWLAWPCQRRWRWGPSQCRARRPGQSRELAAGRWLVGPARPGLMRLLHRRRLGGRRQWSRPRRLLS